MRAHRRSSTTIIGLRFFAVPVVTTRSSCNCTDTNWMMTLRLVLSVMPAKAFRFSPSTSLRIDCGPGMLFEETDDRGAPQGLKIVCWRLFLLLAKPAGFLGFSLGCLLFGAVPDAGAVDSDFVIGLVDGPQDGWAPTSTPADFQVVAEFEIKYAADLPTIRAADLGEDVIGRLERGVLAAGANALEPHHLGAEHVPPTIVVLTRSLPTGLASAVRKIWMWLQHPGCDRTPDGVACPLGFFNGKPIPLAGLPQCVEHGVTGNPSARDRRSHLKAERVRRLVASAMGRHGSKVGSAFLENGLRPSLAASVHAARGLAG